MVCFLPRSAEEGNHLLRYLLVLSLLLNGHAICAQDPASPASLSNLRLLSQRISNPVSQQFTPQQLLAGKRSSPGTDVLNANTNQPVILSPGGSPACLDTSLHLLLHEDSTIVAANFLAQTADGNFLVPGYYYSNTGVSYNMPYLIKCSPQGNIIWTKCYYSPGIYPSNWFSATRIRELSNGDLLMVGQIGVPATDDRRELAVWRLDAKGNILWGRSYESATWTNPITGATEITGIEQDGKGNIYLCGNLRFFEHSEYAFVLKLDQKGNILWDKNYGSSTALAFGIKLLNNQLLLVGGSGPYELPNNINTNILWSIYLNPDNGNNISSRAWWADFGTASFNNSFAYANTSISLLDNGNISVHGTANSDFVGFVTQNLDTINHSIIANFSPDFDFISGIMLSSHHPTNYYNTLVTQHESGRISFTRFAENHNLYNEDIIYGSVDQGIVIKERIYQEQNRSSAMVSHFLFYPPDEDIILQSFSDQVGKVGGLELIRLHDHDGSDVCSGIDTALTFILPYAMAETQMRIDSTVTNAFRLTRHNFINDTVSNLSRITACQVTGIDAYIKPVVSLAQDSILCQGSSKELQAGNGYSSYLWSDGSHLSTLKITSPGKYWVSVTDQHGCEGSDTTRIVGFANAPENFLPHDTSICLPGKLIIKPIQSFQQYEWSDQSTEPDLTVDQPGVYWLQVTDSNQCTGVDTIALTGRVCTQNLSVPNAFTPNGDGKNDMFRPLIYGNVIRYRFSIYSRWGQKVFDSSTLMQGWDGKLGGIAEATGVYVWYCEYQLEGLPEKSEEGTVILIR